jgi:predicted O-methyltransferase YrrM
MSRYIEHPENGPGFLHQALQPHEIGGGFSDNKEQLDRQRRERIQWWRNAPEKAIRYRAGSAVDKNGNSYRYDAGTRLIIGDEKNGEAIEVMDECETPWAFLSVDKAFEEIGPRDRGIKVLERGFGMGITARRVIQDLIPRDGSYTAIELNKAVAEYARRNWKPKQVEGLKNMASGMRGTMPEIDIEIITGEAYEVTKKLAEAGKKFDIIISDTFPLTEDEQGVNDLKDLETLKYCLEPGGVFTFFAYFPGSKGGVVRKQENMIVKHFKDYRLSAATVNPPPSYKFLNPEITGPVRSLPVVICKNPII